MEKSPTDWPLLGLMLLMAALGFALVLGLCWGYVATCQTSSAMPSVCTPIQESPPWTLLSAIAAAPSLLLTWYLRTKQKNAALGVELEQQRIAQEQQVTARFVESVSLLEKKTEQAAQLGGIYALERLACDSTVHVGAVVEILSAFVRKEHAIPNELYETNIADYAETGENATIVTQTAVNVLGRLPAEGRGGSRIDLSDTDLRGFKIVGNFNDANFDRSLFRDAVLVCSLDGASIQGARVRDADFSRATVRVGFRGSETDWSGVGKPGPWAQSV